VTVLIKDMTRRQAAEKLHGIVHPETLVQALEVLGVIKFEQPEPKRQIELVSHSTRFQDTFGTIKVELWPDGLVLWVGGQIRWKN